MPHTKPRTVASFMHVSLDGYFCDPRGDMSFAHKLPDDEEWNKFVAGNTKGGGMLLFGRTTYDMMAAWWPTPKAAQAMPQVAASMNAMPKVVFSRTMRSADWENTTVEHDAVPAVRKMKSETGPNMVILGSGSIVLQLAGEGLLDTLQVVVNPIALGAGKSLFSGLAHRLNLALTDTRVFKNGAVVLWYAPSR